MSSDSERDLVERLRDEIRNVSPVWGDTLTAEDLKTLGALLGEAAETIEDLRTSEIEYDNVLCTQARLLAGVANALKGEPPANALHSHADLPAIAEAIVAERDDEKTRADRVVDYLNAQTVTRMELEGKLGTLQTIVGQYLDLEDTSRAAIGEFMSTLDTVDLNDEDGRAATAVEIARLKLNELSTAVADTAQQLRALLGTPT